MSQCVFYDGKAARQSSNQELVTKLSYLWSTNYVQSAWSGTEWCTEEYSEKGLWR
jgi:hypothetical protein